MLLLDLPGKFRSGYLMKQDPRMYRSSRLGWFLCTVSRSFVSRTQCQVM